MNELINNESKLYLVYLNIANQYAIKLLFISYPHWAPIFCYVLNVPTSADFWIVKFSKVSRCDRHLDDPTIAHDHENAP